MLAKVDMSNTKTAQYGPLEPEAFDETVDGVIRDDYYEAPANWRLVEQQVLHKAMAQVSVLEVPHGAPRYSIRVGTVRVTKTGEVMLSNHISIYDAEDAAALLSDLGAKYVDIRASQKRPRRV